MLTASIDQPARAELVDEVARLLRDAMALYESDAETYALLAAHSRRLVEPLRVALAGMVKAGKSTLLNAIIGEEIAPTDTGECTRVVTWYRYAVSPRVMLFTLDGEKRRLPIVRVDKRLQFDMGELSADQVDRIEVFWPAPALRTLTLIDTPGIASLSTDVSDRSTRFLTPGDDPSEADAIVYLMRHMHASDLRFLEAFHDSSAGGSATINALAVLSRADEVGAGRIDSLLSAREIADRYRHDDTIRSLSLGVVPMAGLLAQTARTLRQSEFRALVSLAELDRADRELLLISADRFCRPNDSIGVDAQTRVNLMRRFGLFGVRLALVMLRSGVSDADELAQALARRSGLDELMQLISVQFEARSALLRARSAIAVLDEVLHHHDRSGTDELKASVERVMANAHDFQELRLLATLRTEPVALTPQQVEEAERLLGGEGVDDRSRLGLHDDFPEADSRSAALEHLQRWRALQHNPASDRALTTVCSTVVRTCEALVAHAPGAARPQRARLVLAAEPRPGSG
ncbi:dynamin family protein [Agreia sp. PsM10]|uniref:dynamin family protein n=1 Tax=Agreia sp. PsM10 TaxID=3030533 RepID=UPI00263A61E6|nr:dynamin family protein [Agreia sp. PsM10]MDN4641376.1 dynamin family protein [Agreia sp. PsM10]